MVTIVKGSVSDYFLIESHMASTRSADVYRAIDRNQGTSVNLWIMKHPLALNSDAIQRFDSRMRLFLAATGSGASLPLRFGVDAEGKAFCSMTQLSGQFVLQSRGDPVEGERRFLKSVRIMARLHAMGIVCGDICAASFYADRSGEIAFIGLMGSFDGEASETAVMPPLETLLFLAPEQRGGRGTTPASDVFSLGVLGYHLLCRGYPYGETVAATVDNAAYERIPAPSAVMKSPPVWADEVLLRSLHPNPDARYPGAQAMLAATRESRDRMQNQSTALVKRQNDAPKPITTRQSEGKVQIGPVSAVNMKRNDAVRMPARAALGMRSNVIVLGSIVAGVIVFSLGLLLLLSPKRGSSIVGADGGVRTSTTSTEKINDEQMALKEGEFKALVLSDDPISHQKLVEAALRAETASARGIPERHLVERARRFGLRNTAEQLTGWFRTLKSPDVPDIYESGLKLLDGGLPLDGRSKAVQEIYAKIPPLGLRVGAALALDAPELDDYAPLVVPLFGDYLQLRDKKSHSPLALLFATQDISLTFGDELTQRRSTLSDEDVLWLLDLFVSPGDPQLPPIAQLAIDRSLLGPLKLEILSVLRDRRDLPPLVITALAHALSDRITPEDLREIGKWYDLDAEKVLLALCGELTDTALLTDTFELLAGKSISREPVASIMKWIRTSHWDQRSTFARSVGIIGNGDKYTTDEIKKAIEPFGRYMKESKLFDAFMKSKDAWLVRYLIDRYPEDFSVTRLLPLLQHPEKEVRIAAISALRKTNDITMLKFIIDQYDLEKDPEVRTAYEEKISFIRDRKRR